MQNEAFWTIGELARLADVTPRTIRYYTGEGLLPPPVTRGKYAMYSQDHLQRLRLIARLKAAYLPLGEIRIRLDQLTTEEIKQLLASDPETPPATISTASEYIGRVLGDRRAPAPPPRPPLGYKAAPSGASMYAGEASLVEHTDSETPAGSHIAEAPASLEPGYSELPTSAGRASLLRRLDPQRSRRSDSPRGTAAATVQTEAWRRVALAHGVELHFHEPTSPETEERIARLLAVARDIFADEI